MFNNLQLQHSTSCESSDLKNTNIPSSLSKRKHYITFTKRRFKYKFIAPESSAI